MAQMNVPQVVGEQADRAYIIDLGVLFDTTGKFNVGTKKEVWEVVLSVVLTSLAGFVGKFLEGLPSLATQVASLIANHIASTSIGVWFYDFRINPTSVTFSDSKMQTLSEYGWGYYDLEHFGNSFTTIQVQGTTGNMYPEKEVMQLLSSRSKIWSGLNVVGNVMGTPSDFRLSLGYIKFEILKKLYASSKQRVLFVLFGKGYFGFFESFEFSMNADNPRRIDYTFTFKAHPQLVFDIFAMDFTGIKTLGHVIDPKDVSLTTMSNAGMFGV